MDNLSKIIGENIKQERILAHLTQKDVAEKIGYSEKSVSKWEAGCGLPSIDTLIELCKIFNTDINCLINKKENEIYYLGIDGGGTKTHYMLTNSEGTVLKEHIGEGTNPVDIGIANTKKVLKENINSITEGYNKKSIYAFAGISGGSTGNNKAILKKFFINLGFADVDNDSDIMSSVALGLGDSNGMIVIMGTGVVGFAVKDGCFKQIAGWGQLFDAGGGGYNLGKDGLYAVLRADDGTGEETLLKPIIEEILGDTVRKSLTEIYSKGKKYIASFSKAVTKASSMGDKVASDIIEENMKEVAKIINAGIKFVEQDSIKIAFNGSLILNNPQFIDIIKKYINSSCNCNFELVTSSPVHGALLLARKLKKEQN